MAIGDDYATLTELKARLKITDTDDDTVLTQSLDVSSRTIEKFCRRQFNDSGSATARQYRPLSRRLVFVDDFSTTSGLVVKIDDDDDGTFETIIPSDQYDPEPLGGIRNGVTGWPFWKIRMIDTETFPPGRRRTVEVTAQWGWTSVPDPVKEACLIGAEELFKLRDAPFGIAGFDQFGAVRVRGNPQFMTLLMPFRRNSVRVA